jgi:branched-chain amino acid transport system permease protein
MKYWRLTNSPQNYLYLLLSLVVLVLLAFLPRLISDYYVSVLISILLYVILTVSWAMFSVPTGYLSLATASFVGVGMYTTAILGEHLPLSVVILIAGIISALIALLVGLACLRLKGVYFSIFTFGLTLLLLNSVLFYEVTMTGKFGRYVVGLDANACYYVFVSIMVALFLFIFLLKRSKYNLALLSIGQGEIASAHLGVNVNIIKVVTFAISAFIMGLAGATIVTQFSYIQSNTAFDMLYSFMPAVMAIFGGFTLVRGQILGAAILSILAQVLLTQFTYFYLLFFGLIILATILFFPQGLIGVWELFWKRQRLFSKPQKANIKG